ncbi:MAG: hypothetical protein HEP71_05175 [Roseivirga sp.]|nr:hypothetical protein [Roseivirga sp.]
MDNWIIPLTLLPGIGMMIMSTSHLSTAISQEISGLIHEESCDTHLVERKITQMSLLNRALVALYLGAASFAITGLIGGISAVQNLMVKDTFIVFLIIGIGCLLVATIFLITFSMRAVRIKKNQYLKSISKS